MQLLSTYETSTDGNPCIIAIVLSDNLFYTIQRFLSQIILDCAYSRPHPASNGIRPNQSKNAPLAVPSETLIMKVYFRTAKPPFQEILSLAANVICKNP